MGRGRKPKPEAQRRSRAVLMRLNGDEHLVLKRRAANHGMRVAVYLRARALSDRRIPTVLDRAVVADLGRVGGNLNQLMKAINTGLRVNERTVQATVNELQRRAHLPAEGTVQDGAFAAHGLDWRLSLIPQGRHGQCCAVLRKLDRSAVLRPLREVLLHPRLVDAVRGLARDAGAGLALVTGVTGSGKTTTLYALMHDAHQARQGTLKVATIEDPIEYPMRFLVQHQVERHRSANAILRGLLRADPDWIFVGEIRDRELLRVAYECALSGHMTLATVHSATVTDTLVRLHDLGLGFSEIGDVLRLVVSQSLVRRLCEACRMPIEGGRYRKGPGCAACGYTGERDRAAVAEFLSVDGKDRELIAALRHGDLDHVEAVVRGAGLTKPVYVHWLQRAGVLDAETAPKALLH